MYIYIYTNKLVHALTVDQWSQPAHSVQLLMPKLLFELLKDLVHLVARYPSQKHQKLASNSSKLKNDHMNPFKPEAFGEVELRSGANGSLRHKYNTHEKSSTTRFIWDN